MIVSKETISLWARHVARSIWVTCTLNQDERNHSLEVQPPLFTSWFTIRHFLKEGFIIIQNIQKNPKETTIFWMVVDFQGIPMRWNQLWLRDCESNIFETYCTHFTTTAIWIQKAVLRVSLHNQKEATGRGKVWKHVIIKPRWKIVVLLAKSTCCYINMTKRKSTISTVYIHLPCFHSHFSVSLKQHIKRHEIFPPEVKHHFQKSSPGIVDDKTLLK